MTHDLHLTLFGWPITRIDGETVQGFISDKAQAIFYYLVLTQETHSRARLAGIFWPELAEKRASANLRNVVYNLQQLVPDYVVAARKTLAFNRGLPHWVDAIALEQTLFSDADSIQIETERETATLYQGELLEGFFLNDAPEFENWLTVERERFRRQALGSLQRLAQHDIQFDHTDLAIPILQQILKVEPWQEETQRQLMLQLARAGDFTEALMQYTRCQQVLADELDMKPLAETEQLAQRIRAARDGPRHNLPLVATPFVGRETLQRELSTAMATPNCRLVTVVGQGGIGKSRLAIQVAQTTGTRYLNGVAWVPLASIEATPSQMTHQLVIALTTTLGQAGFIPLYQRGNIEEYLLQQLKNREMLLLLDNFELFLEAIPFLVQLLGQAPGIQLLITSRERLNIMWEQVIPVEGLLYPDSTAEPAWQDYDAVALFTQSAKRVQPRFAPQADNQAALLDICHLVEGMPLAIELATAWLHEQPCETIAQELAQSIDILKSTDPSRPARQRSMRAAFDYSWSRLTENEQQRFCQLAIFRGGFSLEAARQVVNATASDLKALLDKSLVRSVVSEVTAHLPPSAERYELHELLRQLAAEKLATLDLFDSGLLDKVTAKHSQYYLEFLGRHAPTGAETFTKEMLTMLQPDFGNMQQGWQWAADHQKIDLLATAFVGLTEYYRVNGFFDDGSIFLQNTLDKIEVDLDNSHLNNTEAIYLMGRMLNKLASFANWRAEPAETLRFGQKVLTLTADPALQQSAYQHMGYALETQGKWEQASDYWDRCELLAQQLDDPTILPSVLTQKGWFNWYANNYETALRYFKEALPLQRQVGTQAMLCQTLDGLGGVYQRLGDHAKARFYAEEAWAINSQTTFGASQAVTLLGLGITCNFGADYENALKYTKMSLEISLETDDRSNIGLLYANLCLIYRHMGQNELSHEYGQKAVALSGKIYAPRILAFAQTRLGHTLVCLEEWAEAQTPYEQATENWRDLKQPNFVESLAGLARVQTKRGQMESAKHAVDEVLSYVEREGMVGIVEPILCYLNCYHALVAMNDLTTAQSLLQDAWTQLEGNIAKISDEKMQRDFREQVIAHQELMQLYLRK